MNLYFIKKEIQMRITDLEYSFPKLMDQGYSEEGAKEKIIKDIKRIYLEETGEAADFDIEIEQLDPSENSSDAKGTALLISKEEDVEEVIFISRGSVSAEDWIDNVFGAGIGTGGGIYARESEAFLLDVIDQHDLNDDISIRGFGHSKGSNTLVQMQLNYETFNEVFTFNGAQSNVRQQLIEDSSFLTAVQDRFDAYTESSINSIPQKTSKPLLKTTTKTKARTFIKRVRKVIFSMHLMQCQACLSLGTFKSIKRIM